MIFKDRNLRHSQELEDVQSSSMTLGLHVRYLSDDALSGCDLHHLGGFAAEVEMVWKGVSSSVQEMVNYAKKIWSENLQKALKGTFIDLLATWGQCYKF